MPPPTPAPITTTYKHSPPITTDIYLPSPAPSTPTAYPILINIHGGAFMLGDSRMISMPQVADCLQRGWIVVAPNHRLCPQLDIRDGPLTDIRDCLAWVYAGDGGGGGLGGFLQSNCGNYRVDAQRIMAFGTSSGGMLALGLGFDVPRTPRAILNFYGAIHFSHPTWTRPIPHLQSKLPHNLAPSFLDQIYTETPIPTSSSISLEGQAQPRGPDFSRPRDAFAFSHLANGTVLNAVCPDRARRRDIDPVCNVRAGAFPPTFIVHGADDAMVSVEVSRELWRVLRAEGVRCGMVEVPGEGHTFAMGMEVGGRTWGLQREGFEFLQGVISEY